MSERRYCGCRVPDNGDTYACGFEPVRGDVCARCLPTQLAHRRKVYEEARRACDEARARLLLIEEPTTEYAKKLAEIEAREQAATKGLWVKCAPQGGAVDVRSPAAKRLICYMPEESDATFITHAREDVPWLLAQLRERDEQAHRARAEIERLFMEASSQGESPDYARFGALADVLDALDGRAVSPSQRMDDIGARLLRRSK